MAGEPAAQRGRAIDVVIPVYGNLPVVRRCLSSVLAFRTPALARILVVDDCSPDRETSSYLQALRAHGAIELMRHRENLGFVAAANSGLSATTRDVVLLNSDTEVHGDWAARLMRCAYARENHGTVTPFSNHATICSYPFPPWRSGLPGGMSLANLDDLFARVNRAEMADVPTGVGFCLFIRRACLDDIGPFDVNRFGRGYGEETDFCQRAWRAGWRSVVCADTFVYHDVGGSFGAERPSRARAAEKVLSSLYPDYVRDVRGFIVTNTLGPFRRRVDAARVSLSLRQGVSVAGERVIEMACRLAFQLQARRPASNRMPQ